MKNFLEKLLLLKINYIFINCKNIIQLQDKTTGHLNYF